MLWTAGRESGWDLHGSCGVRMGWDADFILNRRCNHHASAKSLKKHDFG
jgi:hypothetical protein